MYGAALEVSGADGGRGDASSRRGEPIGVRDVAAEDQQFFDVPHRLGNGAGHRFIFAGGAGWRRDQLQPKVVHIAGIDAAAQIVAAGDAAKE